MPDLSPQEMRTLVDAVPHWHHIMRFPHGIVSPGAYDPQELFSFLELPDLRGKRVLDVGTRDGFFAFQLGDLGPATSVPHRRLQRPMMPPTCPARASGRTGP